MEYIKGKTLEQILFVEQQSWAFSDLLRCFCILCDIAEYIAKEQLIYGDWKLSNIMIAEDRMVYFIDFGTSRFVTKSNVKMSLNMCSTPMYTTPEQLEDSCRVLEEHSLVIKRLRNHHKKIRKFLHIHFLLFFVLESRKNFPR